MVEQIPRSRASHAVSGSVCRDLGTGARFRRVSVRLCWPRPYITTALGSPLCDYTETIHGCQALDRDMVDKNDMFYRQLPSDPIDDRLM
jgi:hypothetical protein